MISNRDTIILFIIAIVSSLLAMSFYSEEHVESAQQTYPLTINTQIQFDDIQKISIQRNGELLVLEKNEGKWTQKLPFQLRMDSSSMMLLIRAVQGVLRIGELDKSTELSAIGLGNNANQISITDGKEEVTVRLGRKTLGGRAYAQIGDSVPVVVDQSLHRIAIDMDHRLWRDVRLFPDFTIDGIRIDRSLNNDRLLLDRSSGHWQMLEPVEVRVDEDLLLEWVGRIAAIRVNTFVIDSPTDLAMFGLLHPIASFEVSNQKGDTHKLLVGSRVSAGSQDRYVMLEGCPVVSKVRWELLSPLFPAPEVFVDSTGSAVSRFDIKQVTIRTMDREVVVERDMNRWVNENGIQVDDEAVEQLLRWILDTKPPQISFGQYPKQDEVATIVLSGYDLMPLDAVRIARPEDGRWILENGDNVLRIHPADAGVSLLPFTK